MSFLLSKKAYLLVDSAVITTNALEVNMLNHAKIQNADVQMDTF